MKDTKRDCLKCGAKDSAPPVVDGVQLCNLCFFGEQEEAGGDPFQLEADLIARQRKDTSDD